MQGTVVALFVAPDKISGSVPKHEVCALALGFEGDSRATKGARQVLMVSQDVLREFDLSPGVLYENMVVDGLDVMRLQRGEQLRVGEAILEVTLPCDPCIRMERIRKGLKKALDGKRGMFAKVITSGVIRVGDSVES